MKRDLQPTAASAATIPVHLHRQATNGRSPRAMLHTALRILLRAECTREQLLDRLQERHPETTIHVDDIIRRLTGQQHVTQDGDRLGLTDDGDTFARALPAEHQTAYAGNLSEFERRTATLAEGLHPDLLTSSPTRHLASAADLRAAPVRPGGEQHLQPPSRIGDRLHYRDGRITTMDGTEVQPARGEHAYAPRPNTTRTPRVFAI